jgi:hypothetical protein
MAHGLTLAWIASLRSQRRAVLGFVIAWHWSSQIPSLRGTKWRGNPWLTAKYGILTWTPGLLRCARKNGRWVCHCLIGVSVRLNTEVWAVMFFRFTSKYRHYCALPSTVIIGFNPVISFCLMRSTGQARGWRFGVEKLHHEVFKVTLRSQGILRPQDMPYAHKVFKGRRTCQAWSILWPF